MMNSNNIVSRRQFIKMTATAGTGIALGVQISACTDEVGRMNEAETSIRLIPNIWIEILDSNKIILFYAEAEMGQSVSTSLPMILAEELGADWEQIEVRRAPTSAAYGNQWTGGSTSVRQNWEVLRQAGAITRELLISAARIHFNNETDPFDTRNSNIINLKTDEAIQFGTAIKIAKRLPLPASAEPRPLDSYQLIGKSPLPKHAQDMLTGALTYTSDIHLPEMVYATIIHPPVFGCHYINHDDQPARRIAGYIDSFAIKEGLAVIASNTWAAFSAAENIDINWSISGHENLSGADIQKIMRKSGELPGEIIKEQVTSDPSSELVHLTNIEKFYDTPFQAHATMEPMCCVAHIHDDICEVWAPTQTPTQAKSISKDIFYNHFKRIKSKIKNRLSLHSEPYKDIIIHPQFIGGGFGRRLKNDYVSECVQIAKKINKPVKLQWTRAQDIKHDFYRATSSHQMSAQLDIQTGMVVHWKHKIISPSISDIQIPYDIPNQLITANKIVTPVPLGDWRSVNNSNNIYAVECFIDDIAYELNKDPVEFRVSLLNKEPRLRDVLISARSRAKEHRGKNNVLGCAVFSGYGSYIALFAEISTNNSSPHIIRMIADVDCGLVIDPDQAEAQIMGGLLFALTAYTKSKIEIINGGIKQSNFNDFPLLKLSETPEIDIKISNNQYQPGGLGEVPVPPVAPAVHNALKQTKRNNQTIYIS